LGFALEQPLACRRSLALRIVPIAAAVVGDLRVTALLVLAACDMALAEKPHPQLQAALRVGYRDCMRPRRNAAGKLSAAKQLQPEPLRERARNYLG